jgi:hypothetical protein
MPVKLQSIQPRLGVLDTRRVQPPPKTADATYQGAKYRAWREAVIAKAGRRCEAVDDQGRRCTKAEPRNRMFADHKDEVRDGGDRFDPQNGQCLCGSHHTLKTAQARAARR